jgi:sulfhydrogenase subunit beta (sulfur reductase)
MPSPSVTSPRAGPHRAGDRVLLAAERLGALVAALRDQGFEVLGPRVRDGAVALEPVASAEDLPRGVSDVQAPGRYRLAARADGAYFGHRPGPQPWRHALHPQRQKLLSSRSTPGGGFSVDPEPPAQPRLAFLGVRPCDLRAIAIQDRVLAHGEVLDPHYASRRAGLFTVAVNCGEAGETCFCASMGTGPRAQAGFDLALTELVEGTHRFVVEVGSEAGGAVASALGLSPAPVADVVAAAALSERAAGAMRRAVEVDGLPELLARSAGSARWDEIARRCLSCTSCTLVCPTCYCTNVVDRVDVAGDTAVRWRRWDSCHTCRHSYIHGGSVRRSAAGRYRHWLTHKLSTWKDQFGALGCVGCGRCTTWCPAGIDLTAEVAALRAEAAAAGEEVAS